MIDLRSDTVTKPDDRMRAAMAAAEVGDDVLDHDPTMAKLEETVAGLLGVEAALWVPSGSMGNVIALMLHVKRGDRFLAPALSHVISSELGAGAWLAEGMPDPLPWDGGPGRPKPETLRTAIGGPQPYFNLNTTLLCLENTHNAAGGTVTPLEEYTQLVAVAKEAGLTVHLDGARIWNASIALGLSPAELTVGADTVQVCLSKGLGAPVGSMVAGSAAFVTDARRVRKMLGGGVRQGGVLAAAGLVALENIDSLAEDHANARALAEGLTELGWVAATPDTNIVVASVPDVDHAIAQLREVGVLGYPLPGHVRFVAHRGVSANDITEVLRRIEKG
ncbi:aminotransferase class I/II-fold pyridoxal phosphate-dependent enzyme [Kibdelosporangium philippinense]|uniref:Aminotransferase class I/II-fold pyridoxal phosphate-dependent enzyme n=1 Tax=Kibdelosporangium philippinense TaxID=211113 RepID=A0ABS8ZFL2_9PSEU|nr:GntG family PLP-dependent aldolase [Kibdelosporangium philippinense]MCE7005313.1 aminotransferase class I/II-fold pyridoxal phosphate-dependent enzyme [Kibdelosporangium philippinense]